MKKTMILVLGVVLGLVGVLPVWASDNGSAAITEAYIQRLEAQKKYFDSLAEAGKLTPEQADRAKQHLDIRIEYLKSDDFDPSAAYHGGLRGVRRGDRHFGAPMGRIGARMMGNGFCGVCPYGFNQAPFGAQ